MSAMLYNGHVYHNNVQGNKTVNSLVCYGFDHDRVVQSTKFGMLVP